MFKGLKINSWRQFENVELSFHPRLTILTGANGAGKTTILNLLNNHFGWNSIFLSTPKKDKQGLLKFVSGIFKLFESNTSKYGNNIVIGNLHYSNNVSADLTVPDEVGTSYNISVMNQQSINGLYIPSHRPIYSYRQVSNIPTQPRTRDDIYNSHRSILYNSYFSTSHEKTNYIIKENLIALAMFGYGNQVVTPNPTARQTFEDFQQILRVILPPKLGFQNISIEMPEVNLVTKSGEFSLDAVSGGVASLIDLAWQIFMYPNNNQPFVVTLDEPENHLHPEMQKMLLPNLIKAFPMAQFIVATHNPFIISSSPDSNVYILDYNENNRVISTYLDLVNKAGSSNDILREVLGVSVTLPYWVEDKINSIVERYSNNELNSEAISNLRQEMKEIGMDKLLPETLGRIVDGRK
ncbi:AAA family ATPase [Cohnella cholangitidis]|uniref:AAA family ATPase n=1 Tax=Cohnella cholangitidis TaxID=2598458 RepID=UPI0015F9CEFB|nr:AAA family ATPase [Cohnella cholangitidis]